MAKACVILWVAFLMSAPALAQDPSILFVGLNPTGTGLVAVIDTAGAGKAAGDPAGCLLLDVTHEHLIPVKPCTVVKDIAADEVELAPVSDTLDLKAIYQVTIIGLVLGKKAVPVLQGTYNTLGGAKPPKERACVFSAFKDLFTGSLTAASSPDTSDFYFQGQSTHSRGGDFQGTYNIKTDLSGRCWTGDAISRIGPSFTLQGGNDPSGSPDSLNFSFLWDRPILYSYGPHNIGSLHLVQNATLESTQDFLQKDFVYSVDFMGILRPLVSGKGTLRTHLFPDAGIEVGKNLRSPIAGADGRAISRMKLGATYFLIFDIKKPWLQDISLSASWTRRWPMIPEVAYKANKAGTTPQFLPVGVGTEPRDYVKPTLNLDLTKYFAVTVAYEYGSLPPKYSFLDSKFTLGLTIKAALAAK